MADNLLVCPYDESHVIDSLRMPRHLLKCRKNHPHIELCVCPYNACHEVPQQELRYHMQHCPEKALLNKGIQEDLISMNAEKKVKGYTELPNFRNINYGSDDEMWEDEQEEAYAVPQGRARRSREEGGSLRLPTRQPMAAQFSSIGRGRVEGPSRQDSKSELQAGVNVTATPSRIPNMDLWLKSLGRGRGLVCGRKDS